MTFALAATPVEHLLELHVLEQRLRSAVAAHYRPLWRAVRHLGVPDFEVDDVLQEAFLVFYRKAASVHPQAEHQFLVQSAFRIVRTRQRGFVRRREELKPEFEQFKEVRPSPEEEMNRKERLEVLDGIFAAMPLELRMVFNLCDIEQFSVADAAVVLEIPHGTATSRLRRARELFTKLATRARSARAKDPSR